GKTVPEWSDKPVGQPYLALKKGTRFRPTLSGGGGYIDVHCRTASGQPCVLMRATAASISDKELMPVDRKIGSPVAIIRSRSSRFVTSPDATFHAATFTRSSSSNASIDNGELRNARPRSSACALRPAHCDSANSIRRQYS